MHGNCLFVGEVRKQGVKVSSQISGGTPQSVVSSYYIGLNSPEIGEYGTPISIDDAGNRETFEGWDFDSIWTMDDRCAGGLPSLKYMKKVNRELSKYVLPSITNYSEISNQTIFDDYFDFDIVFDRDIKVNSTNGIYLFNTKDESERIMAEYEAEDNLLHVKIPGGLKKGCKYQLHIAGDCIHDAVVKLF